MKYRLLAPGPTPVPEETLLELAKPVKYHRTPEARQILAEVLQDLQYVFCTRNSIMPMTSSGTGGHLTAGTALVRLWQSVPTFVIRITLLPPPKLKAIAKALDEFAHHLTRTR